MAQVSEEAGLLWDHSDLYHLWRDPVRAWKEHAENVLDAKHAYSIGTILALQAGTDLTQVAQNHVWESAVPSMRKSEGFPS